MVKNKNKKLKMCRKSCIICNKKFIGYPNSIVCSSNCKKSYENNLYSHPLPEKITASIFGDINELLVCIDLMKKNYLVFKALNRSSSLDLVAIKRNKKFCIEVTSGHKVNGVVQYNKRRWKKNYDILAVVVKGEIYYYGKKI